MTYSETKTAERDLRRVVALVMLAWTLLAILQGCAGRTAYQVDGIERSYLDAGFAPCDTDADCEIKNGGSY
jgi:hypothetical protein